MGQQRGPRTGAGAGQQPGMTRWSRSGQTALSTLSTRCRTRAERSVAGSATGSGGRSQSRTTSCRRFFLVVGGIGDDCGGDRRQGRVDISRRACVGIAGHGPYAVGHLVAQHPRHLPTGCHTDADPDVTPGPGRVEEVGQLRAQQRGRVHPDQVRGDRLGGRFRRGSRSWRGRDRSRQGHRCRLRHRSGPGQGGPERSGRRRSGVRRPGGHRRLRRRQDRCLGLRRAHQLGTGVERDRLLSVQGEAHMSRTSRSPGTFRPRLLRLIGGQPP